MKAQWIGDDTQVSKRRIRITASTPLRSEASRLDEMIAAIAPREWTYRLEAVGEHEGVRPLEAVGVNGGMVGVWATIAGTVADCVLQIAPMHYDTYQLVHVDGRYLLLEMPRGRQQWHLKMVIS